MRRVLSSRAHRARAGLGIWLRSRSRFVAQLASAFLLLSGAAISEASASAPQRTEEPQGAFAVASVRRVDVPRGLPQPIRALPNGRFEALDAFLKNLIEWAYALQGGERVIGFSDVLHQRFAVRAVLPEPLDPAETPGPEQFRPAVRALLAERFGLKFRREDRAIETGVLRLAPAGRRRPGLRALEEGCVRSGAIVTTTNRDVADGSGSTPCWIRAIDGHLVGAGTLGDLARLLSAMIRRPIVDETGLVGIYEFDLTFDLGLHAQLAFGDPVTHDLSSFSDALAEQLGLTLQTRRDAASMLVIEHIEWPSEN